MPKTNRIKNFTTDRISNCENRVYVRCNIGGIKMKLEFLKVEKIVETDKNKIIYIPTGASSLVLKIKSFL